MLAAVVGQDLPAKWEELTAADFQKAVADALRAIKADQVSPRLQKEFFEGSKEPIKTKQ